MRLKAALIVLFFLPSLCLPAGQGSSFWTKLAEVARVKKEGRVHAAALPEKETVPLLALKWWVVRLEGGKDNAVPADTPFMSGDSIKLAFAPNQNGYLYVINKQEGSGGQIIFPLGSKAPDKAVKDEVFYAPACRKRPVTGAFKTLPAPDTCYFKLDQETGDETLVVIFSREPIVDLAKSLAGGNGTISAQVIEQLKATSGQKLQTFAGQKTALLRGGQDRFATFVTNTNVSDNEELIDYIVLKHEK